MRYLPGAPLRLMFTASKRRRKKIPIKFNFPAKKVEGRKREGKANVLRPQLLMEGAETWQAAGRVRALETLRVTPSCALFLNPSHRHDASVLSVVFRPEQQFPSGFCTVLPLVTNDKQSAIVNARVEQSTAGADSAVFATNTIILIAKTTK